MAQAGLGMVTGGLLVLFSVSAALASEFYRVFLVRWLDPQDEVGLIELYDHEHDPDENVNVSEAHPELVQRLTRRLRAKMAQVVATSHGE